MPIEPPQQEADDEPLFRVIYIIDVNAAVARGAAKGAHQIMSDPVSMGRGRVARRQAEAGAISAAQRCAQRRAGVARCLWLHRLG